MARGLILSTQARATISSFTTKLPLSPSKCKNLPFVFHYLRLHPVSAPSTRLFCTTCSVSQVETEPISITTNYRESFSRRMAMAGLKPHHRIALAVSGGPDSMALCVLTAGWKTDDYNAVGKSDDGFIDGLLAIIVDHGLRVESNEEAQVVSRRVSDMGIRCEIASCEWSNGKPTQGHLQEMAREMRYKIFQNVCVQHRINVLLIAHHADDQAELFILRLSRNSGVLGLAGMAFTSQMFPSSSHFCSQNSKNEGILVVRPLLHFSKKDLYKICEGSSQEWVEDPTNQSSLYARNRIRMSFGNLSSDVFQFELQAVISACRRTRAYVDKVCSDLINQAVTIMDEGYAIIDVGVLNPSKVPDICLSKFVALVLQFISQRQRPVRGSSSKLLLDYIRTSPSKTSLTAAGCYLCPSPGSRGTKILVCCSVNCPLPSKMESVYKQSIQEEEHDIPTGLEQIIADGKSYSDSFVGASDAHFLDLKSDSVLTEAKRLNIISETTYRIAVSLQKDESEQFKPKTEDKVDYKPKSKVAPMSPFLSEPLQPGQVCNFMNRFLVTWEISKDYAARLVPQDSDSDIGDESKNHHCSACGVDHDMSAAVRRMIESDWLYLAKLLKSPSSDNSLEESVTSKTEQIEENEEHSSDYLRLSADKALQLLKSIPVAARRSLPVLVNSQGLLLSIPTIGFQCCPLLTVSCEFKPSVPLGGGHNSFI